MRTRIGSFALIACLVACSGGAETITEPDGPFGGVYHLRQVNDAGLPFYFFPAWYPGRATIPGLLSTTLRSAELNVRPDGSYTWSTQLDEVASKPGSTLLETVAWSVRRDAYGTWTYTPATGTVSLEGIDQLGPYVLTGTVTSNVLTLSSTFTGKPNSTFVLER